MSFWKKVKLTAAADRLVEEQLYAEVLREFESGVRRDGLWAKAFQNSQGDEQKANALYIGYRVQSIKDEAEIVAALAEQYEVENTKTHARLNPPNIGNEKQAPAKSDNLQSRVLCNDGNCIGVIGKDGHCRICGKPLMPETLDGDFFVQHKEPDVQCKTCGFIAYGDAPEIAIKAICLGCGNIMGGEVPPKNKIADSWSLPLPTDCVLPLPTDCVLSLLSIFGIILLVVLGPIFLFFWIVI